MNNDQYYLEKVLISPGDIVEAGTSYKAKYMFSDSMFGAGVDEYLEKRLTGKSASTFVYVYDFASNNSVTKYFDHDDFYYGVAHCDDIEIFFPGFLWDQEIPSENLDIMRESLGKMWINFATYGDPTPGNAEIKWESTNKYPWNHARLGTLESNKLVVLKNENGYARSRYELWKNLKPHIGCISYGIYV
uniref:Carboxylesterase type B domain-containing protein n=1 Tax=Megaselia scalaris TaxID=36166 RepID=T1H1Q7_MEGSC